MVIRATFPTWHSALAFRPRIANLFHTGPVFKQTATPTSHESRSSLPSLFLRACSNSSGHDLSQGSLASFAGYATSAAANPALQSLWNLGRLNHVAIAVPKLELASNFFKTILQAKVSDVLPQKEHGVNVVFVEFKECPTKIELLEPLGDKSPIKNFLEKNANGGIHHVCIEVDDIHNCIRHLKEKGIRVLDEPKIGAHNKLVVFLHPKDCNGVLTEIEQA